MRKTLIFMTIAIILGSICGKVLFTKYKDTSLVFNESKKLFFLQEGVYSSNESLDSNTKNINPKLIIPNKGKYYVYVGITGNINNANKIKNIYKDKGYSIYEKSIEVDDIEFINNIEQFDLLIDSASSNDDISTIEEVVLASYEDVLKNS